MSVPYSQIKPIPLRWLWPGVIPFGEPVILAGPGGTGKGMAVTDLAARFTRGLPMPGCEDEREPGSVVLIAPEDDPNTAVAYRLRAARADIAAVHDLTLTDAGGPFEMPGDLGELRETVDGLPGPVLVIIDPLLACCTAPVATNMGARRVLAPLQRLAKETGAAVVISHHTVKSGQVAGSKGLTDAARLVFTVTPDRENPAERVMSPYKANICGTATEQRFTVEGDGTAAHAVWLDRAAVMVRREGARTGSGSPARPAPARPCKHPWLLGTPAQCGNCPLRRQAAPRTAGAPRPAPRLPSAITRTLITAPPATPPRPEAPRAAAASRPVPVPAAPVFAAVRATAAPGGQPVTTEIGHEYEDLEEAQEACGQDAGRALVWRRRDPHTWAALLRPLAGGQPVSYCVSDHTG